MLLDTSVLLRTLQPLHPQLEIVRSAIKILTSRGSQLHITAQNLIELWVVATRPAGQNGLGLRPAQAAVELTRIKSMFVFLPDTPAIYPAWEALVIGHAVSGKQPHDARLVAAMQVHHLTAVLTFDKTGLSRFAGIRVVDPADVLVDEGASGNHQESGQPPSP